MNLAQRTVELAARRAYGKLLSILSLRCRDLSEAEDALAQALLKALERWPEDGVPEQPEAWLLTVARRELLDAGRRASTRSSAQQALLALMEESHSQRTHTIPDERARLLFCCAHPALDSKLHAPLMLQTVLGLDAERIGSALLVSPKTMGQRLWRAKLKIREAAIPLEVPEGEELKARLPAVLEAIYAAYGAAWDDQLGQEGSSLGLRTESLWLARVLVQVLPTQAEALGLLALLLHAEARQAARRSRHGDFVPLEEQDRLLWDQALQEEAEHWLRLASTLQQIGPYQLEAAIHSAWVDGLRRGQLDLTNLARLHQGLYELAPCAGTAVALAASLARISGPAEALALLEPKYEGYQAYHATRAHLLAQLGQAQEAEQEYRRAAGLTSDPALRSYLLERTNQV